MSPPPRVLTEKLSSQGYPPTKKPFHPLGHPRQTFQTCRTGRLLQGLEADPRFCLIPDSFTRRSYVVTMDSGQNLRG